MAFEQADKKEHTLPIRIDNAQARFAMTAEGPGYEHAGIQEAYGYTLVTPAIIQKRFGFIPDDSIRTWSEAAAQLAVDPYESIYDFLRYAYVAKLYNFAETYGKHMDATPKHVFRYNQRTFVAYDPYIRSGLSTSEYTRPELSYPGDKTVVTCLENGCTVQFTRDIWARPNTEDRRLAIHDQYFYDASCTIGMTRVVPDNDPVVAVMDAPSAEVVMHTEDQTNRLCNLLEAGVDVFSRANWQLQPDSLSACVRIAQAVPFLNVSHSNQLYQRTVGYALQPNEYMFDRRQVSAVIHLVRAQPRLFHEGLTAIEKSTVHLTNPPLMEVIEALVASIATRTDTDQPHWNFVRSWFGHRALDPTAEAKIAQASSVYSLLLQRLDLADEITFASFHGALTNTLIHGTVSIKKAARVIEEYLPQYRQLTVEYLKKQGIPLDAQTELVPLLQRSVRWLEAR